MARLIGNGVGKKHHHHGIQPCRASTQSNQRIHIGRVIEKGLPVREIYCNQINESTLGQLMAYFMMETIAACYIIGVNPFNQPAVEQGKILTKQYLR